MNGTLKNELMLGIMNWLCHEFSLCSMNCPKGHCGGKIYVLIVYHCSYHKQGVNLSRGFFGFFNPLNDSRGRYFTRVVLLRLRGFLHAFHLVEMTVRGGCLAKDSTAPH